MATMQKAKEIEALIGPSVEAMGYALVRVAFVGGKTLQVMAEREGGDGMTADDCAELSRAISAILDVEDPIADSYLLEVSSPGIDRPLVKSADFERFAGHEAKLETVQPIEGRKRFSGTLVGVREGSVDIETPEGRQSIPVESIAKAKLVLTDDLIAEAERRRRGA